MKPYDDNLEMQNDELKEENAKLTVDIKIWKENHKRKIEEILKLKGNLKELLEALKRLVERIDFNEGLGAYKGGPAWVMTPAREAITKAGGK